MKNEYLERNKILETVCKFCENKTCLGDKGYCVVTTPTLPCSLRVALEYMDADWYDEKEN